jgi:hypothetical protein
VAKLVRRVKLVAERRPGVMTETEVARIERDEQAGVAELGLRLAGTKRLPVALNAIDPLGDKGNQRAEHCRSVQEMAN